MAITWRLAANRAHAIRRTDRCGQGRISARDRLAARMAEYKRCRNGRQYAAGSSHCICTQAERKAALAQVPAHLREWVADLVHRMGSDAMTDIRNERERNETLRAIRAPAAVPGAGRCRRPHPRPERAGVPAGTAKSIGRARVHHRPGASVLQNTTSAARSGPQRSPSLLRSSRCSNPGTPERN